VFEKKQPAPTRNQPAGGKSEIILLKNNLNELKSLSMSIGLPQSKTSDNSWIK